jgi:hypothetical protein
MASFFMLELACGVAFAWLEAAGVAAMLGEASSNAKAAPVTSFPYMTILLLPGGICFAGRNKIGIEDENDLSPR